MPAPTPVLYNSANPVVQIVEAHSVGDDGWSEVYHLYCPLATDPLGTALQRHQTIIGLRRLAVPQDHILEAIRVSDVTIFGDSRLKFPPQYGLGAGSVIGDVTNPCLGYFMNVTDPTGTIGDTRIYRGWGTGQIVWTPDSPRTTVPPGAVLSMLQNIGTELTSTRTVGGIATTYVQRSFGRPEKAGGPEVRDGLRVAVTGAGTLQFITDAPVPDGWIPGKRLHVRVNRAPCVRGVSGVHRITAIEVVGLVASVVTSTVYRCDPGNLGALVGAGFVDVLAFDPIGFANPGGAGKRDTGRPFFLTRGRQRNRP